MFDEATAIAWQPSLFGSDETGVDEAFTTAERLELDEESWLEWVPGWMRGADRVFAGLLERLPWTQRTVRMYDRLLAEPRLVWWWAEGEGTGSPPAPVVEHARHVLSARYGVHFDSIGCNLYRDGRDSVAWHGDKLRHTQECSVVAIVSLGDRRPFLLRPTGGGRSRSFSVAHGDLLVMGGACQHRWQHAVPKVAASGPRISVTYRHAMLRPDDLVSRPARAIVN